VNFRVKKQNKNKKDERKKRNHLATNIKKGE